MEVNPCLLNGNTLEIHKIGYEWKKLGTMKVGLKACGFDLPIEINLKYWPIWINMLYISYLIVRYLICDIPCSDLFKHG